MLGVRGLTSPHWLRMTPTLRLSAFFAAERHCAAGRYICWPWDAQQQTPRIPLLLLNDGTARQTDREMDVRTDARPFVGPVLHKRAMSVCCGWDELFCVSRYVRKQPSLYAEIDVALIIVTMATVYAFHLALCMGWSDVTESTVTTRSPFCGYNTI